LEYLTWLYVDNPGGGVVGFNAYEGDVLAGHYACIPTQLNVGGSKLNGLLSLNTAVHPLFQGQGLFTELAEKTYKSAADIGFECIYGVANANSTPGFVKKLGFQNVAPLEAKLGLLDMTFNQELCEQLVQFNRIWTPELLTWRCNNPSNRMSISVDAMGFASFTAPADYKIVRAYAPFYPASICQANKSKTSFGVRLFIGLLPDGVSSFRSFFDIPDRFKPSPLNLIYKNLGSTTGILNPKTIMLGFHDFDAY
jgi:GNAT superfamily N-acetyltransferase